MDRIIANQTGEVYLDNKCDFSVYVENKMVTRVVERQFGVIGEA